MGLGLFAHCNLRLEGATATAGLHSVWIVEGKALFFKALIPIDLQTVQIQCALLVHNYSDTVLFVTAVFGIVEIFIECDRIAFSVRITAMGLYLSSNQNSIENGIHYSRHIAVNDFSRCASKCITLPIYKCMRDGRETTRETDAVPG